MLRNVRDRGSHGITRKLFKKLGDDLERRIVVRYPLRVPVLFSWAEGDSEHTRGGFTRDVSPNGAFILCEGQDHPSRGMSVRIEVMLPPMDAAHGVKLRSRGETVRTCTPGEEHGFAVAAIFTMHDTADSESTECRS